MCIYTNTRYDGGFEVDPQMLFQLDGRLHENLFQTERVSIADRFMASSQYTVELIMYAQIVITCIALSWNEAT